jgi:hypothetical protein
MHGAPTHQVGRSSRMQSGTDCAVPFACCEVEDVCVKQVRVVNIRAMVSS